MTARDLIRAVHTHGVTIALHGPEHILLAPPGLVPSDLRQAIREQREALLTLLEAFEERAGIAEYCAGLPRVEAEALAWACVLEEQEHTGCAACGLPDTADTIR